MSRVYSTSSVAIFSLLLASIFSPSVQSHDVLDTVVANIRGPTTPQDAQIEDHLEQTPGSQALEDYREVAEILRQQSIFAPLFKNPVEIPQLLDVVSKNVSQACLGQYSYALNAFLSASETWAIQMFDAFGKFPSGIISGHMSDYGDFYECINLRGEYAPNSDSAKEVVRGRYLYTSLNAAPASRNLQGLDLDRRTQMGIKLDPQPKVGSDNVLSSIFRPGMGTCFPASCSREDVQQILNSFWESLGGNYTQTVMSSYTNEKPDFDRGDYFMIVILVLIGALCLIGTLWDVVGPTKGLLAQVLLAFSVYTNSKRWASTRAGSENLGCLHGLRFLSMAWVVLCHGYMTLILTPIWNYFEIAVMWRDYSFAPILNGYVAVDTFFTLSGTLVAYGLLKELDRTKGRFNYGLFVVHRFLRLTPTYAIIIGATATILPYLGNGPNWSYIDAESLACEKYWWHNILYINNFFSYDGTSACYGEGWYLAIDMQLYIVSPLIIYPLWRWKKIGFGLLGLASIVSIIVTAVITAQKDLPPTMTVTVGQKSFQYDIYKRAWTRAGPYLVGIGLGYLLHYRAQNKAKFPALPMVAVAAGWLLSTALALTIIFVAVPFFDPANAEATFTAWYSVLYACLHRPLWGLVIAWISFACISGYGGWVNKLLSLKVFMPLGRLTFCMYITSYHIQMIYHYSNPHSERYSPYRTVYFFFAHLVMSGMVAFLLTVTLESPFMQLEKLLFSSRKPAPRKPDSESNGIISEQESTADTSDSKVSVKVEKAEV